jgi:acyl-coenzyme A thioesterase PaaI-like protein
LSEIIQEHLLEVCLVNISVVILESTETEDVPGGGQILEQKVNRKQPNSKMCLVCGLKNPYGLKASFYELENNELVCLFTPREEHQSYPGRLHGGIVTAILDETIERVAMVDKKEDVWGVTVEFTVRFKKPIPLNVELKVVGRLTKDSHRFFEGSGEIRLPNGEVAATGHGRFLKLPPAQIPGFDLVEQEWQTVVTESDPRLFDL